ncbi:MAG: GNAT family N-acetyltransferase [Ruminococcus sp.]|nr:GNAT family N-acetyltransferase [Ruminococcus sp.]
MNLNNKIFKGDDVSEFSDAAQIRKTVFLDEQAFSYDLDDTDKIAFHAVVYNDNSPVATGRFFFDENNTPHIGRVAVLKEYRQYGIGRYLMEILENFAAEQGAEYITLGAQVRASGFYGKLGYVEYGDIFYDEYCEHINMRKMLR